MQLAWNWGGRSLGYRLGVAGGTGVAFQLNGSSSDLASVSATVPPMPAAVAPTAMPAAPASVTNPPTGVAPRGMPGARVAVDSVTNGEVAPGVVPHSRRVATPDPAAGGVEVTAVTKSLTPNMPPCQVADAMSAKPVD